MWAWEKGVTPHSVIRALGPWGPRLCERYVVGRFNHHGAVHGMWGLGKLAAGL